MKKRKNKLINLLQIGILFFGISFSLWNCEKEPQLEASIIEATESPFSHKIISLEEAPELKEFFNYKIKSKIQAKSTFESIVFFNKERVLAVIDTLQNTNYSLQFVFEDTPNGEFYNLVIGKNPQGDLKTPFILKYVCNENQKSVFIENNFDMNFFIGNISLHRFTDYFASNYFSKTSDPCGPDTSGNEESCANQNVNFTGYSGFGDATDSNNTDGWNPIDPENSGDSSNPLDIGGGGGNCSWEIGTTGPCGYGGTTLHSSSVCGPQGNGPGIYTQVTINCGGMNKTAAKTSSDDCDGCTKEFSGVGINADNLIIDKVFIDEKFKEHPCLNDVYVKMGRATKFQEYLQNFEASFSVADLRFTADDNFGNNNQGYVNAMAITIPPLTSSEIVIVFNTDSNTTGDITNKPDVFKAVAMIHELLHAEMYRKMLDAVKATEISGNNLNWAIWTSEQFYNDFLDSLENKYFGIFDYFTRYKYSTDEPHEWQHQQMAQSYRDIVKQALTDYDSSLTETQKEALSWIGLNKANIVAWQNHNNKDAIENTLTNIKNTFPNGCN